MNCEYFLLCDNEAAGTVAHPVLTAVPTCTRCAARFDLQITPFSAPHNPAETAGHSQKELVQ